MPPTSAAAPERATVTPPAAPIAPEQAWDRLRRRIAATDCDFNPAVQHWAKMYTQVANQFSASLSEAMPSLLTVIEQIEQRDLPGEFAFLPYVESNYTPVPPNGDRAAGIWQLMPDTAREAGLAITPDYDGRLDLVASTDTALGLIRRYEDEFGDWRVADMAYNAGEYGMRELVSEAKPDMSAKEIGRLRVGRGAHDHLAKLLALGCVVAHPERYRIVLPEPGAGDQLVSIEFPAPVDLTLAARLAGLDATQLHRLNPGLLRGRMPANGPFHLLVPASRRVAMEQTLGKLPQYAWREWHEVALKQSETLSLFASEYDLDLSALSAINAIGGDVPLAPGTHLLLPGHNGSDEALVQDFTPRDRPELPPDTVLVHAGDTLWSIAHRYGLRVADLEHWNRLKPSSMLHLGQRLHLTEPELDGGGLTVSAAPADR